MVTPARRKRSVVRFLDECWKWKGVAGEISRLKEAAVPSDAVQHVQADLEDGRGGWTAFATCSIPRDTQPRLSLCCAGRMTYELGEEYPSSRDTERARTIHRNESRGAIRALFRWRAERWLVGLQLIEGCCTHHAMMLAVPAATRRQVRLTLRRQRKERGCKRQAQYGEQRNGDEPTQYPHSITTRSSPANRHPHRQKYHGLKDRASRAEFPVPLRLRRPLVF
jgi:hypothetical protein